MPDYSVVEALRIEHDITITELMDGENTAGGSDAKDFVSGVVMEISITVMVNR